MVEAMTRLPWRLAVWLALLGFPFSGFAHRLDEYLQATLVVIEPDGIKLQINLTPGMAVAVPVLALMDRNHDGVISTNEAAAYAEFFQHDLALRLDERPLELKCTTSEFPATDELRTGSGIIQLEYATASIAFASGTHELTFENRHQTNWSVFLVNAALPKSSAIQITRQTRSENQSTGRIEFIFHPPPADWSGVRRIVLPLTLALLAVVIRAVKLRRRTPSASGR
jgi:hypothetical protein